MDNKNNLNKSTSKNVDVTLVSPIKSDDNTEAVDRETTQNPFSFPVMIYDNADLQKLQILNDNKGKSGIYRWTNLINGKSYIGNSANLNRRFREYYNIHHLESALKKSNSKIFGSLLKYGYSQFSLEILEYCDISVLLNREQFYMDSLMPEYNILKLAGSRAGYRYSKESLAKIWTAERKANHKNWLKLFNESPFAKENLKNMQAMNSFKIEIFDIITNKTTVFDSIRAASREIGCNHATILFALNHTQEKGFARVFKKRYKCRYL